MNMVMHVHIHCITSFNKIFSFHTAVEMFGHEDPIIVGLTRKLTCSTKLHVTSIELFLVGLGIPVESTTEQELVFTIDPEDTALDGAMFTCRVNTASSVYEETITLTVIGT